MPEPLLEGADVPGKSPVPGADPDPAGRRPAVVLAGEHLDPQQSGPPLHHDLLEQAEPKSPGSVGTLSGPNAMNGSPSR